MITETTVFTDSMANKLAHNLKIVLKERGLTASQLSRETGIPNTTIANWLAGQSPKNLDQIYKVAKYLNMSIEALVFSTEFRVESKTVNRDGDMLDGLYEVILRRVK